MAFAIQIVFWGHNYYPLLCRSEHRKLLDIVFRSIPTRKTVIMKNVDCPLSNFE